MKLFTQIFVYYSWIWVLNMNMKLFPPAKITSFHHDYALEINSLVIINRFCDWFCLCLFMNYSTIVPPSFKTLWTLSRNIFFPVIWNNSIIELVELNLALIFILRIILRLSSKREHPFWRIDLMQSSYLYLFITFAIVFLLKFNFLI